MNKIDNLKSLCSEMDNKYEFAKIVAENFKKNIDYVNQNWLQKEWKIPNKHIDEIISIAQNYIFNQIERKRKILIDTGYKN